MQGTNVHTMRGYPWHTYSENSQAPHIFTVPDASLIMITALLVRVQTSTKSGNREFLAEIAASDGQPMWYMGQPQERQPRNSIVWWQWGQGVELTKDFAIAESEEKAFTGPLPFNLLLPAGAKISFKDASETDEPNDLVDLHLAGLHYPVDTPGQEVVTRLFQGAMS